MNKWRIFKYVRLKFVDNVDKVHKYKLCNLFDVEQCDQSIEVMNK